VQHFDKYNGKQCIAEQTDQTALQIVDS